MQTVKKNAWDLITEEKYEVEMPAPEEVGKAILEIDFPLAGLMNREVADEVAKILQLSDEQKNAGGKRQKDGTIPFVFRDGIVLPTLRNLLSQGKLKQPEGSGKAYVPVENAFRQTFVEPSLNSGLGLSPEELIEENYQKIREELAAELLQKIKDNTPAFFEELVIDLLVKMGYGGSREDAGKAVGGSGDGGIDGIIKADPLGLNVVYIQAKRWEGNVGAPPVRDFVGALDGEGVQDGIFITTSDFNPAAENFVERSSKRVILINGSQLARYMIDHNVGVSTVEIYEIKRVDSDYFAENTVNP
ncbi:restriction endonuclease [Candidatus Poribacteria bacterium]|nr:restriction endonuclease [Candidatus Poribacteria bacterium]